uniref:Glycerol-3-phosphate acyltransferase n=1 Tax=uncultured Armatimonadetes bacterium TaxID=157466 RepID=A0A6J4ISW6_9BACT|nr:GH51 [uncultured Armatimonadetes bacterium]
MPPIHFRKAAVHATVTAVAALTALLPARAQQPGITISAGKPAAKVSPLLYGIFFEEINHAGDGGLYAELVENRSFEDDPAGPRSWTPTLPGASAAVLALDKSQPLHEKNRTALRLEVRAAGPGERAGVANDGYWGMAVRRGEGYRLSLWARADAVMGAGPLRVRLERTGGETIAEAEIRGLSGSAWKQHRVTLRPRVSDDKARLVIESARPGTLWLDMVSLFPEKTWKNRPNGLRPDLAEKLAAMKPAFLRFPGGCFVEGDRLADAYRWKETIGPIESRPGRPNLWGYRSTDGLGYHEYLQLSEDLGAEPMLVVNCGMSHKEVEPLASMQVWIQDALDALEYANGPVTSKWGAVRARAGHPKPFNLRLLEIGNENGGPAYNERYALLYDAILARYPQTRIIANVWGGVPRSRPTPILDEHYYHNPDWFFTNANKYDTYDRKGPQIYVGEYAVTQNAGLGNLHAALSEAAFMMGMERNGDVVTMASYAPLFVNVNDRKWNPDAIGFDSARSYGTPSYYVQKLFAEHRPEHALPTKVTAPPTVAKPATGTVGLGTWLTQAEFKDIKVTGPGGAALFNSDFGAGVPVTNWNVVRGDWKAEGGAFRQTNLGTDMRAVLRSPAVEALSNYTLTLKARKISGAEGFLIMFRVGGAGDYYWWNLGGWNNTRHAVERAAGGGWIVVGTGLAAILGHTYSPFLRFKGGKGVATSLGVIVGLSPLVAGLSLGVFALVVAATRFVSLGSILAALTQASLFWLPLFDGHAAPLPFRLFGLLAALFVIVKHRGNIERLRQGTETRFGAKKPDAGPENTPPV